MITFAQAREIALSYFEEDYAPEDEFVVSESGWENDEYYQLVVGPYIQVYGPRTEEEVKKLRADDGPFVTVRKSDGAVEAHYGLTDEGVPFLIEDAVEITL